MTRNERFAVRQFAAWSALFEKFVVPELTTPQKQRLLGLREQMTSAVVTAPRQRRRHRSCRPAL